MKKYFLLCALFLSANAVIADEAKPKSQEAAAAEKLADMYKRAANRTMASRYNALSMPDSGLDDVAFFLFTRELYKNEEPSLIKREEGYKDNEFKMNLFSLTQNTKIIEQNKQLIEQNKQIIALLTAIKNKK